MDVKRLIAPEAGLTTKLDILSTAEPSLIDQAFAKLEKEEKQNGG
jgi:hypothetical protein